MKLKAGQKLGKYRIVKRIGAGGFAEVYEAQDTVEGISVALKIPRAGLVTEAVLNDFRKEARLASRLDHPNIQLIKTADHVDGTFVIVSRLGVGTLEERLKGRRSLRTCVALAEHMLAALAHAHENGIIHCDVKPSNFIMTADGELRLSDFGIARVAQRTLAASGSGTVGYLAPEQALGKPSQRSDVFSLGLVLHELFLREVPEWPFDWPTDAIRRNRRQMRPDLGAFLKRALAVDQYARYADAVQMSTAFSRIKPRLLAAETRRRRRREQTTDATWRSVREKEFRRRFGRGLEADHACENCQGPVSEPMRGCPWCGARRTQHAGTNRWTHACPRCHRGLKADWRNCPWCYGHGFDLETTRSYDDVRYSARCSGRRCPRRQLMPFMRYCPWCRTKVKQAWPVPHTKDRCPRCRWGVVRDFWEYCPWCHKALRHHSGGPRARSSAEKR